jgi:hypothetical protein
MSSTIIPSTDFQSILNAALDSYAKQTGIDLSKVEYGTYDRRS